MKLGLDDTFHISKYRYLLIIFKDQVEFNHFINTHRLYFLCHDNEKHK